MEIEFRSRTFGYTQMKKDELAALASDANLLLGLGEEKHPSIVELSKNLIEAKTTEDELRIYEQAMPEIVHNRQMGMSAHRFCYFFFRIFISDDSKEDTPEELASDLRQLGVGSDPNKPDPKITKLIELIKQESPWFKEFRLKNTYKKGLFPCIESTGSTVELRGVFNREMRKGEKIEGYSKDVGFDSEKLVPVISISITLDSGDPNRFVFQGSPDDIESLIERLKAALHKSKMLVELSERMK